MPEPHTQRTSHSHAPGENPHMHGHEGHDHDHGGGFLGWLRHTFAHSHAAHERVDEALESSERGIWALKVSLVGLGVTAILQLIIVILSGSTALLADTIHNFGDATTSIPLWIAFVLLRRGQTRRFTYGYGRAEDLAGMIIVLLIFVSACVAGYESVSRLLHPQPLTHLAWVAAAAIIGFIGNEAIAQFRIRIGREINSAALVADGVHSRVDGFTSLAVLGSVLGVVIGFPILDPLIGLGITVAILFIVKDAVTSIFHRLLDGIEPDILSALEHAPSHVPGVLGVHQVRARWLGHKVYADLDIAINADLSLTQAHDLAHQVEREMFKHVPSFGGAQVHVTPYVSGQEQ